MQMKLLKSNSDTYTALLRTIVNKCLKDLYFPEKLEVLDTVSISKYYSLLQRKN